MPKPDPYTVLGIPRTADADTIRKAHRRRAKRAHADAGGNDEEMRRVNEAWMILRDPARRERFDQTGEDDQRDTAVTDLIGMFIAACEVLPEEFGADPVELVRRKLLKMTESTNAAIKDMTQRAAKHRRTAARVKAKSNKENLLATALEAHADGLERKTTTANDELARIARMKAILDGYSFDGIKPEYVSGASFADLLEVLKTTNPQKPLAKNSWMGE